MSSAQLHIWTEVPKERIAPEIYGHSIAHLGRGVQEGIWVGEKSRIPNDKGLRLDVLAALKQLRAPTLKWPAGSHANSYHWRDGIGPLKDRPVTVNSLAQQTEPNNFGTVEYLGLCSELGCAPYLALNICSGSPTEARDWAEYCNFGGDSSLGRLRNKHSGGRPYPVEYWALGSEVWLDGGRMSGGDYAKEYLRFASALRPMLAQSSLVACGAGNAMWDHDFCETMPCHDLLDVFSIPCSISGEYDVAGDMSATLADSLAGLENRIDGADRLLSYYYPGRRIDLSIDEWGNQRNVACSDNGFEQDCTLYDALFAGAALNMFNRWSHRIQMANLAYAVNVFHSVAITDGLAMCVTPTYHVFDMMRPHMGAVSLMNEMDCPELCEAWSVGALSASVSSSGKRVFVSVANLAGDKDIETTICLRDAKISGATGRALTGSECNSENSFDNPKNVAPKRLKLEPANGELVHTFPAHSFTVMSLSLA